MLPYLQETFYKFRNVFIEIEHDHLILQTTGAQLDEPSPLVYPRVNKNGDKLSGTPVKWKKQLNFTHDKKPVRGFIMITNPGSYHGSGIRLLRNHRVIYGTRGGGRQNKPQVLLGTSNKYASQRIYGEIHLNDFPVNFMKTGFDISMESLYRAIKSQITARPPHVEEDYVQQATNFRKSKATPDPKPRRKPRKKSRLKRDPKAGKEIPFSEDLNKSLDKLRNKKFFRLYSSLCSISLIDHPVLAYVGTWTLLESLATEMGKNDGTSFNSFLNSKVGQFTTDRGLRNDCKNVINDIHAKGNMNKHSGQYEAMHAQQLASDFPTIEKFLIHCAETLAQATP